MQEKKKIVIIDNLMGVALLMKLFFLQRNYEVYITGIFPDALQLVKLCQPNLIYLNSSLRGNLDKEIKRLEEAAPSAKILIDKFDPTADY